MTRVRPVCRLSGPEHGPFSSLVNGRVPCVSFERCTDRTVADCITPRKFWTAPVYGAKSQPAHGTTTRPITRHPGTKRPFSRLHTAVCSSSSTRKTAVRAFSGQHTGTTRVHTTCATLVGARAGQLTCTAVLAQLARVELPARKSVYTRVMRARCIGVRRA